MIRSPLMTVMTDAVMKAARSPEARLRRGREPAGLAQGPGRLRLRRRPQGREDHPRRAAEGAAGLRLRSWRRAASSRAPDKSHRWHIDPLDGTTNFLHGLPQFAISVGLERDGQIVAGVIYDPAKDELFIAEKGKGAYLNNRRMRVAARRDDGRRARGLAACRTSASGDHPRFIKRARGRDGATSAACAGSAPPPSTSPMWPAGALDAYWERGLNSWDMAAGIAPGARGRRLRLRRRRRRRSARRRARSPAATRPCTASSLELLKAAKPAEPPLFAAMLAAPAGA